MIWKAALVALFAFVVALVSFAMARHSYQPPQHPYSQSGQQSTKTDGSKNEVTESWWDAFWRATWREPINIFTAVLATATTALFVIGLVQIGFLISADRTAKTAAHTSREALVKSQRAFVRSNGFPWLWRPDIGRPGRYLYDIGPIIENAGATPTVDMKIIDNSVLRDTPLPDGFDFPYGVEPGNALIGPHQPIGAGGVTILDDDLVAVQNGTKFFYIWGDITYRDVFEGTPLHTTQFCTQITRVLGNPLDPRDPAVGPRATSVEITFGIYKEHNKTD